MTPLTTKAAEIRAGLVDRLRDDRHCNDWYLRQEAAALIEQQAAELTEARERAKAGEYFAQNYAAQVDQERARATTAESERVELLREKERQEAVTAGWQDISTAPKDGTLIDVWATRETTGTSQRYTDIRWGRRVWGSEYVGEPCWVGFDEQYSAITPTHWMPRPDHPSALENGPAGLADANSKSPAPSSQSERIEVLEAALRPFAEAAEHDIGSTETDADIFRPMGQYNRAPKITVGDLRRARSALAPLGEE